MFQYRRSSRKKTRPPRINTFSFFSNSRRPLDTFNENDRLPTAPLGLWLPRPLHGAFCTILEARLAGGSRRRKGWEALKLAEQWRINFFAKKNPGHWPGSALDEGCGWRLGSSSSSTDYQWQPFESSIDSSAKSVFRKVSWWKWTGSENFSEWKRRSLRSPAIHTYCSGIFRGRWGTIVRNVFLRFFFSTRAAVAAAAASLPHFLSPYPPALSFSPGLPSSQTTPSLLRIESVSAWTLPHNHSIAPCFSGDGTIIIML